MERILIATDFSANAAHAAEYGYALAAQLRANIVLCNAFNVPAEVPEAGAMAWPQFEYEELLKDSATELKELENNLRRKTRTRWFEPFVTRVSNAGSVQEVISTAVVKEHISLMVMGTHGNTGLSGMIMGDHAKRMIDEARCPLLLIPAAAEPGLIKKVAFATDFKDPEKDLQAIFKLIPVLKKLNAELLITHVYEDADQAIDMKVQIESFLLELSNKADFPNIYYRILKSDEPEEGLDWLCRFGQVNMLAMVHRERSFLERLLKGSYTKKMAHRITVPLLVIPEK